VLPRPRGSEEEQNEADHHQWQQVLRLLLAVGTMPLERSLHDRHPSTFPSSAQFTIRTFKDADP
jgi:hypothetical protein